MNPLPPYRLPVLAYHHVDPFLRGDGSVPPAILGEQLDALREIGGACDPKEAIGAFERGAVPPRGVLLTFDDAYRSLLDHAIPALESRGMRGVFFVITDYCGAWDAWNVRAPVRSDHLGWNELRELTTRGHAVGSQSRSHHALVKFDRERIKAELHGSADRLDAELGSTSRFLAYPYGSFDDKVIGVARKRYVCSFASGSPGSRDWREEPHAIHRITVRPEWPADEVVRRIELYRSR